MATPAHHELHHLVDRLPLDQACRLLRLVETDPELANYVPEASVQIERNDQEEQTAGGEPCRRISFAGIFNGGPADLAERAEDYLHEHFNRSA